MNSQSDISGQDLEGRQVGAGTQSDLLWEHLKTVPAFRALLRSVEARFYQHIELPGPILDIGCGDGVFADLTFEQPVAVGVDPWWGPLKKAVRTHAYDLTAQGLGDSLPFASNSFASAFSNSVLEHIPEVQPVLYEIHRVLKPDGRFVATMPSHLYTTELGGAKFLERLRLNSMADLYRRSFNRIARHEHVDPPEIWAARFADAGFAVEQWQYYFSTKALRALEIGHLQGIPSAVLHALTGHWILAPWESNLKITERWVRPFYEEEPPHPGTMILFVLRKLEDRPAAVHLPNPKPIPVLQDKGILPVSPVIGTAAAEAGSARMSSYGVPPVSETDLNRSSDRSLSLSSLFQSIRNAPKKRWLIVIGILLSFLGYQQANLSSSAGRDSLSLFLWGLSILTALFAFYDGRPSDQLKPLAVPRRPWEIPAVLLLLAISLAFRTVDLTSHPFILSGTEASIGLDAVAVAQGGINNPFSTAWLTNPTMPLYLHAIPVSILGSTILAVRLLSPFIGAATVLAVYWLGRRLFGPGVGLLATVFMTGSHVHIHYSRLGMTNIWDPLVVTLAVGLIYTAWQRRSRNQWLAAGVLIGLNAYFYTSSHLFPLILLGIFVYLLFDWRELWLQRSHIFAAALVALTTALPQILYYMGNPAIFMDRVNALGIVQSGWYLLESEAAGISPAAVIVRQLLTGLLSFQISPDNSPAYMSSGSAFGFWASLLMLVGVLLALWRSKQFRFALLIIWMAAAL
ncbi:MAG: glycosyltransferase family 39 protein, partial [Candidatus Promineifilaceae bacterium]